MYTLLQHSLRPFASSLGGQFATELGGQFLRNMQLDNGEPPADHLLVAEACSEELKSSLKFLCNRDRELLTLYFGLGIGSPMTLEEIGKKFNVNATYVCRLKDDAVKRLRNFPAVRSLLCCH